MNLISGDVTATAVERFLTLDPVRSSIRPPVVFSHYYRVETPKSGTRERSATSDSSPCLDAPLNYRPSSACLEMFDFLFNVGRLAMV